MSNNHKHSNSNKQTAKAVSVPAKADVQILPPATREEAPPEKTSGPASSFVKHAWKEWSLYSFQPEKVSFPMIKNYDAFTSLNKEAVDAFVKSSTILAKGFEEIGRHVASVAQVSVETNIATSKAALGVKTLKEFLDLQSDWLRHSFDTALSEATKLSEITVKVANQAAEPIQTHFTTSLSKVGVPTTTAKAA